VDDIIKPKYKSTVLVNDNHYNYYEHIFFAVIYNTALRYEVCMILYQSNLSHFLFNINVINQSYTIFFLDIYYIIWESITFM